MTGYTKLFSSILTSTIWQEDSDTKIVWVTMLALADAQGFVDATVPGLAHIAGVSVEKTREAIQKFLSPDPDSRTKHDQGRRIEQVNGGWRILNYAYYREKRDPEERKVYQREWDRQHRPSGHTRSKKKTARHGPTQSDTVRHSPTQAEAEADITIDISSTLGCRNSDQLRLSDLLLTLILQRNPNFQRGKLKRKGGRERLLQSWAVHLDRLMRIDDRSAEHTEKVIRWCQADDFWQNNILSTSKLRERFDQLELKMQGPKNGQSKAKYDDDGQRTADKRDFAGQPAGQWIR